MVKHVVMWRLHENTDENRSIIREMLTRLPGFIPELRTLEVGEDINRGPVAYDLVLITTHADREGLRKYQKHPEHVAVAERIKDMAKERAVVDFEQ